MHVRHVTAKKKRVATGRDGQARFGRAWLRSKAAPLSAVVLVVAISVAVFLYRERVADLKEYTYLGAFLVSLVGNATVILPAPVPVILASLGVALYEDVGLIGPIIVGLAGGAGAGIGELAGYVVGYSGRGIVQRSRLYSRLVDWVGKWGAGSYLHLHLSALLPL